MYAGKYTIGGQTAVIGRRPSILQGESRMTALNISDALENVALFRGLSEEELAKVGQNLYLRDFPANAMIITEGQPGEVVYVVLSGTLKVFNIQPDGTEVIISIMGAGDTVGEMSLVDSVGRSASVITLEPSVLLWMHRTAFQECLATMNTFAQNLIRIMTSRLRLNTEHIQTLASLDVNGRVARQLLAFADKYGQPDEKGDVQIQIRLTQSDIADLVGASRKRVNQVIVALKHQELISIDDDYRITLHDRKKLAKICYR